MLPDVGFDAPDARDASLADFAHDVGHDCAHCRAIRRMGPAAPGNPLARLMASAAGSIVTEDEADRVVSSLPKKQRRKLARTAQKRGMSGLLAALRAAQ